jgi:hypothetical protein
MCSRAPPTSRLAQLEELLAERPADTDAQWTALYARAHARGLLAGFGSATPPPLGLEQPPSPTGVGIVGLPPSALRPSRPAEGELALPVSQWALRCQWVLCAVALYALCRLGGEALGERAAVAHCAGVSVLVAEHALLGAPLTRAVVSALNRAYETRLASHEAGHFLVAYLHGLPVTAYQLLSPHGAPRTVFLHEQLAVQTSRGRVADATLATLSAVLVAGLVAEALDFGSADGGASDERMLRAAARAARPEWQGDELEALQGSAAAAVAELLREHKGAHAAIAAAMLARAPVIEILVAAADELGGDGAAADARVPLARAWPSAMTTARGEARGWRAAWSSLRGGGGTF